MKIFFGEEIKLNRNVLWRKSKSIEKNCGEKQNENCFPSIYIKRKSKSIEKNCGEKQNEHAFLVFP